MTRWRRENIGTVLPGPIENANRIVLEARDRGTIKGIHDIVAELIRFPPEYGRALLVAGGRELGAVVVDSRETANRCIRLLKRHRNARTMFFPLDGLRPLRRRLPHREFRGLVGVRGFATDLVRVRAKYRIAVDLVFQDTLVVEDMWTARRLKVGGLRIVTLSGNLMQHPVPLARRPPRVGRSHGGHKGREAQSMVRRSGNLRSLATGET
jgi:chromosome segregation ATPase